MKWLEMCNAMALNSKCLSRQIGAIITTKDGKYYVSGGYNGPVSGAVHCSNKEYRVRLINKYLSENKQQVVAKEYLQYLDICPRRYMGFSPKSGSGLPYCQAAHAERNAITNAARLGRATEGMEMWMNCGIPCLECAKSIVNAGIKKIHVVDTSVYEKEGITGLDILLAGEVRVEVIDGGK